MNRDSNYVKTNAARFIIACFTIGLIGTFIYLAWPYFSVFSNPEEIRRLIITAGVWGPSIFVGPFWGLIYTLIGATVGFTLIFFFSKKLGRPFVERFIDKCGYRQ